MLNITDIRIFKLNGGTNLLAKASITINNVLVITGLKVIRTKNGDLMVGFPSESYQKNGKTEYKDIVFSLDKGFRDFINAEVLKAFNNA
jgi:DNA-binding cell septation regulator SpoVG